MNITTALQQAYLQLADSSDNVRVDAESLLCHTLNKPRSYIYTWPEAELSVAQTDFFNILLSRRAQGEPIAYILGKKEFWSLELSVSTATLIPRPETELLVELALAQLPVDKICHVLDLGTGSGAIALAIAKERPRCQVLAIDSSAAALAIATANRDNYQLSNLKLLQSNWFESIHKEQRFDAVVANPPYIAPNDPHLTRGDLRFEPSQALSTSNHGLSDLYHIAEQATHHLQPHGWLMMEHGYDQSQALTEKLTNLNYIQITDHLDYNDQPRVICGRRAAA